MHQAASRATPSQPKLTNGEKRSRSKRVIPAPCIPQTDPVSAIRAANGPWYQSVSKVSIPRAQTSWRPVAQWAATKAAAASAKSTWGRGIAGAGGEAGAVGGAFSTVYAEKASRTP